MRRNWHDRVEAAGGPRRATGARTLLPRVLAAACLASVPLAGRALAAEPPPATNLLPPSDDASIISLQDENASISANRLTDRYYVNGLQASYTSPTDVTPAWLQNFDDVLFGAGRERFAFQAEQSIFTPADTGAPVPPPGDRPYAGILQLQGSVIHDTLDTRSVVTLTAGWEGPATGAEQLQNGFHDVISQSHDAGWDTQLRNQGFAQLMINHIWRLGVADFGGVQVDALPELTGAAGNLRTYAEGGVLLRLGQGLDSDYGVPRVSPGMTGTDAYKPTRRFVWYLFAGGDGQAVANDITFDNEDAPYFTNVAMIHDVGEFEGGAAFILYGVRLSYTQVFQTHEFVGQRGGLHEFGSLAGSVRF